MATPRLLPAIGGLALAIVAAACAAPTPTPTLAPEPTASERVTEELLPGMQWGELEPGLAWFVRVHVDEGIGYLDLAASPDDDKARILDGLYALGGDEFLPADVDKVTDRGWEIAAEVVSSSLREEKEAAERENALAELAAEAYLVDDNLYLRWRKIEDRATGAALFHQLGNLLSRNGLYRSLTDEERAALPPRERALEEWYRIIRLEDDDMREGLLDWWVSEYEGTEEGDYVLRNTNQTMRMPRYLNVQLGNTAQMKAVKASAEAMERHILQETGDPAAAARYLEWFWMEKETNEAFMRKMDELGYPDPALDDDLRDAAPTATPRPTPTPRPKLYDFRRNAGVTEMWNGAKWVSWEDARPCWKTHSPSRNRVVWSRVGCNIWLGTLASITKPFAERDGQCWAEPPVPIRISDFWVRIDCPPSRPTATPRPTPTPWPTATPRPTPTPALYDFRSTAHGRPEMWNGEKWITWEDVRPCWETTPAPGSRDSVVWSLVDCDTRGALRAATTPTTKPFLERRAGQCYAEPPSRIWTNGYWVRIDCPPPPPATPTPIPCPSTGYGAMSCVRAWPARVPVRAAVECWIDAECGGFEYYERVAKLDASEPVLYWVAPDLARRNPVVVNQVGRALQRMEPLLGVEFEETESRNAARLVIRMEEGRECGDNSRTGACGSVRFAYHLNGASGPDGWEIALSEVMIRTRYTNPESAYRILIHEFGHALTGMGHSYRCGSLMRDWEDDGFIRGCVAAGYPRYHREFSSMDEAVMLINSHPAVAAGTRRADWRDFICGRDC